MALCTFVGKDLVFVSQPALLRYNVAIWGYPAISIGRRNHTGYEGLSHSILVSDQGTSQGSAGKGWDIAA